MLPLPILNVRLTACHADWQQMTPTEQGHHCAHCHRTVIDFTTSTQADLEAAFQTATDGRVCGRFRPSQLAPPPQLRPKLRRFLVALVLVCGLGLTSSEVWAQVRKAARTASCENPTELVLKKPEELNPVALAELEEFLLAPLGVVPVKEQLAFGMVAEIMPVYKNGTEEELAKFFRQNLIYPAESKVSGRVYVSFVVTKTGAIKDIRILKGLDPAIDAEALRVMQLMEPWTPGWQNKHPVDVNFTMPITFKPN